VRGIGHRLQHFDALFGRRRLADDMEAMWDQRVFELKHGLRQFADRDGLIGPAGLSFGQVKRAGLRLDQRG